MDAATRDVLMRINSSIPKNLMKKLMVKRYDNPAIIKVLKAAVKSSKISPEKREEYALALQNPSIISKSWQVDEKIEAQISKWVEDRMNEAIAKGEIPDPKNDPEIQEITKKRIVTGKQIGRAHV